MALSAGPVVTEDFAVEVVAPKWRTLDALKGHLKRTNTYVLLQKVHTAVFERPHLLGPEPSLPPRQPTLMDRLIEWMVYVFVSGLWVIITASFAYLYHKNKEISQRDPTAMLNIEEFREFKHGICSCFGAPDICLLSYLCPGIRWAQSIYVMGFVGFWVALALFIGLDFLGTITGEVFVYIALAIILAYWRQEMRLAFNMRRQGGVTYVEDCMLYFWCLCCTVTQEARQVEDALKVGHPAVAAKGGSL